MAIFEVAFRVLLNALHWSGNLLTGQSLFPSFKSILWSRSPRLVWEVVEPREKPVAASVFKVSYTMYPHHADVHGRVFGGEVMKLVDVVAGIAARKHTTKPCVTVSVDRVIFLCPVFVGDILHLSVSVNRSWGSSLETGVKIIKEDFRTGNKTYACHAYLTFVARSTKVLKLYETFYDIVMFRQPSVIKVQTPIVLPQTILEQKRYLLAGRRRGYRMKQSSEWNKLLDHFKDYVLSLNYPTDPNGSHQQATDEELRKIERELIAESYLKEDSEVRVEDGMVIAEVLGNLNPIKVPLVEIENILAERETKAFRKLKMSKNHQSHSELEEEEEKDQHNEWRSGSGSILKVENTLATTVWIVRPQHCNSMGVLFGGTLMRWLEEVANLSARHISCVTWATAAIDSMTLRASAQPGHIVQLRSIVVKVWNSSIELYCLAKAETRDGKEIFISDAFISLVAIDHQTNEPIRKPLKQVESSNIWAKIMSEKSDSRRQGRLADKAMLQKVYYSR
ncbi:hypothetical protein CROQUDRAFT_657376 [Cronartium quercuum f. sp. fusiforme G11]|uniref:HotDog ACOT-type domain-containing protein n=1 Tax=Cronartium quercuum f. sp. fusiforme G11 TaxID=708437 RepID=A0A9P6NI38_9BASI|nr:hypothetical protein CROQUDRAFT_657376 [Cronartium quercuum f. sp. fusiforme G11]